MKLTRTTLATIGVSALAAASLAVTPAVTAHAASTVTNPGFNANGATSSPTGWSASGTTAASYSEATSNGYNGDADQTAVG